MAEVRIRLRETPVSFSFDSAAVPSSGGGGFVPTYIAPAETFTVPEHRQALFAMTIDNEGILVVDGYLIQVD